MTMCVRIIETETKLLHALAHNDEEVKELLLAEMDRKDRIKDAPEEDERIAVMTP
jgi:hypothetical protein